MSALRAARQRGSSSGLGAVTKESQNAQLISYISGSSKVRQAVCSAHAARSDAWGLAHAPTLHCMQLGLGVPGPIPYYPRSRGRT
eukprot:364183-Chlamydomonas_euryale.AAC.8